MANTLTPLIPSIIANFQSVLREKASLPRMVNANFGVERAAINQTITIPISGVNASYDITPAATPPALGDTVVTNTSIAVTKSRGQKFHLTGDDFIRAGAQGAAFQSIQMQQAFRALVNEVHSDLAGLHINATEALGTAATTPFASDATLFADVEKLLNDSLAPPGDRFCLIDTAAKANLSKLSTLLKVNEAGSADLLRDGIIGKLDGIGITWDNDVKQFTKGTGAGYTSDTAGYAIGATVITLITGTGTVLAGDVVTFAGDTTKYVVGTGVAAPGAITLTSGLKVALAASAVAMTIAGTSRRNMVFHREAIGLVARPPAKPPGGDMAVDEVLVQDPVTGLTISVSFYKGYNAVWYEAGLAWGVKTLRPTLLKLILG